MIIPGAMKLKDCAKELGVTLPTLQAYHKAGLIQFTNISAGSKLGRYVVTQQQLDAFRDALSQRTVGGSLPVQTKDESQGNQSQVLRVRRHV